MRSKIFLIRGQYNLAQKITLGEYERVNMDTLVHVLALRDSHVIAPYDPQNMDETIQHQSCIGRFLETVAAENHQHLLACEYADAMVHRGTIKAVEGFAMFTNWVYDMVKAFHKNAGTICVEVTCCLPKERSVVIDGIKHAWNEAMEILRPNPSLG